MVSSSAKPDITKDAYQMNSEIIFCITHYIIVIVAAAVIKMCHLE